MSIQSIPRFSPPAGATPNELAANGPGSVAAQAWQASFALHQEAQREADDRARVIEADRASVIHAFNEYAGELAARMLAWPQLGLLGGAAVGSGLALRAALRSPSREGDPAGPWDRVLLEVLGGAAGGAVAGYFAGVFAGEVMGPRRPRMPATLPLDVEAKLLRAAFKERRGERQPGADELGALAALFTAVPVWRIEGWRSTWTALAREYAGQGGVIAPVAVEMARAVVPPTVGRVIGVVAGRR